MVKILILLMVMTIVLNGLTFVLVVNQSPLPAAGEGGTGAPLSAGVRPAVERNPQLDGIEGLLRKMNDDLAQLHRKVESLERKASAPAPSANRTLPLAPRQPTTPQVRTGPIDYSDVPPDAAAEVEGAADPEED
jgi:hypothetical protein